MSDYRYVPKAHLLPRGGKKRGKAEEEKKEETWGRVRGQLKGWVTRLMSRQVAQLQKQPSTLINTLSTQKPPLWLGLVCARVCLYVCVTPASPLISRHVRDWRQQGVSVSVHCVWVRDSRRECEIGEIRQLTFKPPHLPSATPPTTHTHAHSIPLQRHFHSPLRSRVTSVHTCVREQAFDYMNTQDNELLHKDFLFLLKKTLFQGSVKCLFWKENTDCL